MKIYVLGPPKKTVWSPLKWWLYSRFRFIMLVVRLSFLLKDKGERLDIRTAWEVSRCIWLED